jgi:hypothetical protein
MRRLLLLAYQPASPVKRLNVQTYLSFATLLLGYSDLAIGLLARFHVRLFHSVVLYHAFVWIDERVVHLGLLGALIALLGAFRDRKAVACLSIIANLLMCVLAAMSHEG